MRAVELMPLKLGRSFLVSTRRSWKHMRGNKCIRKFFAAIVAPGATIGVKLESCTWLSPCETVNKALSVWKGARTASHSQISVFLTLHILCFTKFLLGYECISFAARETDLLSVQCLQAFSLQEILKSFPFLLMPFEIHTLTLRTCCISLITVFLCMTVAHKWQS